MTDLFIIATLLANKKLQNTIYINGEAILYQKLVFTYLGSETDLHVICLDLKSLHSHKYHIYFILTNLQPVLISIGI